MRKRGSLGFSLPLLIVIFVFVLALVIVALLGGPLGRSLFPNLHMPGWISIPEPHVTLPGEEAFAIFHFPIRNSVVAAWLTMIVLVILSWLATRRMKLVPGRFQAAFEFLLGMIYSLSIRVAGEKNGRRFFPMVCTIFLFVAFNGWLSLLPGFGASIKILNPEGVWVHLFRGANTDFNTPLAIALASFFFVEFYGVRTSGIKYLSKFINVGPFFKSLTGLFRGGKGIFDRVIDIFVGGVGIFVGLVELMSEFVRNLSFTFRLFGNMTAGEILLLIITFLVPWLIPLTPFYPLEILVSLIQALIFSILTLVFMTLATAGHGDEHGHESK